MKNTVNSERLHRGTVAALAAMLLVGAALPARAASLSPALDIIAAEHTMAKSGLSGTEVHFSREDFKNSLGVDSVGKITIASLPDMTLGHLQLGSRYVEIGQVISEKNLDSLKFVPYGKEELEAVFSFCRGSDPFGTAYECKVYTLDTVNTAPVIASSDSVSASVGSGEITVYSGVTHLGTIPATDAESDPMTFEILHMPSHGSVKLTNRTQGYFEYMADSDYTGLDSFTVCATDKYGNRSAEAKILLRAMAPADGEVFADMDGHWANAAVISCVRANVIDAAEADECFYPDELVSRAEFLSLAMSAAGYSGFSTSNTGFADDAQIPLQYKGSIAAANALGIVHGVETDGVRMFYPNNQITRSEAAVIISRLTGIGSADSVSVFADDAVPAWASGALSGLIDAGILRGSGDSIDVYAPLTRAAAIQLAAAIVERG